MKKTYQLLPIALGLLASIFLTLPSCDKMDDIQRKYAEKTEQIYLGKVDSLKYAPGFGRAKLTWYISSDPRIDQTVIYWNLRKDSIVKEFNRASPGVVKDSITIDNLPEGTTLFEFRNVNKEGETSLYSSASVTIWGQNFADGLHARELEELDFDYSQSLYTITLSPAVEGDSVVYSQVVYTNKHGQQKTVNIDRDSANAMLADFPDGGEFSFQTIFFPPQGIDTVYNDIKTFKAPKAVSNRGTKISFVGNKDNKYFAGDGNSVYEWKKNGDLILYAVNADGSLTQTKSIPSLVPLSSYREFFFYDDDKFIGISKSNAVSMHQIENDKLVFVKTPSGATTFGSGFSFAQFIPAKGYFFSLTAGTGDLKTWLANNDATWGAPNGSTVAKGYTIYDPLMLFNFRTLLGVDENGYLWSIPVSISGAVGSKSRIGSGWNRFKKVFSVGTKLYCMESNGDFYVYDNFNATDNYWIVD